MPEGYLSIRRWCRTRCARHVTGRPPFLVMRQSMPHVQKRLLMHRLVLENRVHRFSPIQQRVAGPIQIGVHQRVEHPLIGLVREAHHAPFWQRRQRRQASAKADGVAARTDARVRVDRRTAECTLH